MGAAGSVIAKDLPSEVNFAEFCAFAKEKVFVDEGIRFIAFLI